MYEVHITAFEHPKKEDIEKFTNYNKENLPEAKTLLIGLNSGKFPLQLIATTKVSDIDEKWVVLASEMLFGFYEGFPIVRTKVESSNLEGDFVYFEAHWKIIRPIQSLYRKLQQDFYKDEGFHFSKNMLVEKTCWLTSRVNNSAKSARNIFDEQTSILQEDQVIETHHYERVIVDTNRGLDIGWADV